MKNEVTPGDWSALTNAHGQLNVWALDDKRKPVTMVCRDVDSAADARLIIAAKDLQFELIRARQLLRTDPAHAAIVAEIDKALLKARWL